MFLITEEHDLAGGLFSLLYGAYSGFFRLLLYFKCIICIRKEPAMEEQNKRPEPPKDKDGKPMAPPKDKDGRPMPPPAKKS